MSEILAQVTRGPMVESVHRGSVVSRYQRRRRTAVLGRRPRPCHLYAFLRQAFTGHERTAFRYG